MKIRGFGLAKIRTRERWPRKLPMHDDMAMARKLRDAGPLLGAYSKSSITVQRLYMFAVPLR